MALRTKYSYADEVLLGVRAQYPGRDIHIDPREIFLKLDQWVNDRAKAGFLLNWKVFKSQHIDEGYLTRWEYITVTDPDNKAPSYFQIPAQYAELPDNQGINQVYFENSFTSTKTKYFNPVIITSFKDLSSYRNTVGEYLEGRISCYPRGGFMYFDRGEINTKYGRIGLALVVRDASAITDDAAYPIPADIQKTMINEIIEFYRLKLLQPQDNIKDATSTIKQ